MQAARTSLSVYQYAAPTVLAPLGLWLWSSTASHGAVVAIAWGIPIAWAYIVPAIGTNVLKVWEFDVRLRLGRFRPHHGFVFGSATSMIAWLAHGHPADGLNDALRYGFVIGCVLGFINLVYEVKALQSGILRVYNEPWARGEGPAAIAFDYAPWFFGGFGAVYGFGLGIAEWWTATASPNFWAGVALFAVVLVLSIAVPVAGFIFRSYRVHGHSGTRPSKSVSSRP